MIDVLLVSDEIESEGLNEFQRLRVLLHARGIELRLLRAGGVGSNPDVIDCPGLVSRWCRPWVLRGLTSENGIKPPDLLHGVGLAFGDVALELAERWRCPYVLTVEEFPRSGAALRLSRHWCRGLIVESQDLADDLIAGFGVPERWINVINPGIIPAEPIDRGAASECRIPVIGTAFWNRLQGLTTFFEATRLLLENGRDVEIVIAGPRVDEPDLRRHSEYFGIKDRLTLANLFREGEAFWSVLNVFVQASPGPSTGRLLPMALANGIPVVVSDVPGLRSWVRHESTGLRFPPGDAKALAKSLELMLDAPDWAWELGGRGRQFVAGSCTPELQLDRFASVYHRCAQSRCPGAEPQRPGTVATGSSTEAPLADNASRVPRRRS